MEYAARLNWGCIPQDKAGAEAYEHEFGRVYAAKNGLAFPEDWDWEEPEPKRRQVDESQYEQVRDKYEALKHEHALLAKKARKAEEVIAIARTKIRGDLGMAKHVYVGYKAMAGSTAKPFDIWVIDYMAACINDFT
jgi:hypothetical protein